jgi:hypothetical protein
MWTQPSGVTMSTAYYQEAAAFVTWAVKWMCDRHATEGKAVLTNSVPALEAACGKNVCPFLTGRYMLGRLHEAAEAGDASIALNALDSSMAKVWRKYWMNNQLAPPGFGWGGEKIVRWGGR